MSETSALMSYLGAVVLVAVFCIFYTSADPTGPQLAGWSGLQAVMTNPLGSLNLGQTACTDPDPFTTVACWLGNLVNGLVGSIIWVANTLIAVGAGLFGIMTLQFVPALPWEGQVLVLLFVGPFWALLILTVLHLLRGN